MSDTPFTDTMSFTDFYKKLKRFRLFQPSIGILALAACVIFCFFFVDYTTIGKGLSFPLQNERFLWMKSVYERRKKVDLPSETQGGDCDLFDGDWVWDESYPLYQSKDCKFLDEGFRCEENGRADSSYTKWRWQPRNCNMTRFNAKDMLEKLRNKRVAFVGDSIGRNQWESFLCMLSSGVSDKDSIYEVNGEPITKHKGFLIFMFKEYNCTVEYYRAPYLVLQSRPPANVPSEVKTTLKLDQMDWSSNKWKDADMLIFNSGHWWNYEKTIRGGCYFQEGSKVKMDMHVDTAYQKSLETVRNYIRSEVNTTKTHVFFRSYSPVHFSGGNWKTGGACHKETLPDLTSAIVPSPTWTTYNIFNEAITGYLNITKMDVLDITVMSSRRRDGHMSLYYLGKSGPAALHRQDCSHWCLPGVPDTWNELLYALFLKRNLVQSSNLSNSHAQV